MKRRLGDTMEDKPDTKPVNGDAAEDTHKTVATIVAQQLANTLLAPLNAGNSARFGRIAFANEEQKSVDAFLTQKLGKESLSRRPGPGGRKLTYIESCKAIELANRAFGFNGWSCRIIECKEEFREKRGDRWSLAYSSFVRIELKDGTSHEDVGFGTSDGQRDLGAALEQAKKASISDARKRALRLFGEYLGNSCYDREHIKDVNSNRPMAPLAAAPNVLLPAQQQQRPPQQTTNCAAAARPPVPNQQTEGQQGGKLQQKQNQQQQQQQQRPPQQAANCAVAARPPVPNQQTEGQQGGQLQQNQNQQQQQQRPPQQAMNCAVVARPPVPNQQTEGQQGGQLQQNQNQQQLQELQRQQQIQQIQLQQQQKTPQQQQQRWKPPQVLRNPLTANGSAGVQARSSEVSTSSSAASSSTPQHQQQQRRGYTSNAPPPTRMVAVNYPLPTVVKSELPTTIRAQPNAQFNMEDLSLSQFDYDANASEASNPTKRMRT